MDKERFLDWIKSKDIEEISLHHFRDFLEKFLIDMDIVKYNMDYFNKDLLVVNIEHIELVLEEWPDNGNQYILVCISVLYKKKYYRKQGNENKLRLKKDSLKYFGTYKAYYLLNGDFYKEELEM